MSTADLVLYNKLKTKLGDEETIALLNHIAQSQVDLEKKQAEILVTKIDLKVELADLKVELAELKVDLTKLIVTISVTTIGIILGGVFAMFKMLLP